MNNRLIQQPGRDSKPALDTSLSSTSIWSRTLRQVADQLAADGDASVAAARSILKEESARLHSDYSPLQPFRQAIATFLEKSTGISPGLNSSVILPTAVNIILSQVVQRLRDRTRAVLSTNRWEKREQDEDDEQARMLRFVGVGMLVTGLYCLVSLTVCVWKACRKGQASRASAVAAIELERIETSNSNTRNLDGLLKAVDILTADVKKLRNDQDKTGRREEREDHERRRVPYLGFPYAARAGSAWPVQTRRDEERHEVVPLQHAM